MFIYTYTYTYTFYLLTLLLECLEPKTPCFLGRAENKSNFSVNLVRPSIWSVRLTFLLKFHNAIAP